MDRGSYWVSAAVVSISAVSGSAKLQVVIERDCS